VEQKVQVEALVRQTYDGRGYLRGEKFQMTASDAADAVAVRCVLLVPAPAVPKPEITKETSRVMVTRELSVAGTTGEAPAAEGTPDAQDPAQDASDDATGNTRRSGTPQRPYSHRAMAARKN
jgi:hypothetical protein